MDHSEMQPMDANQYLGSGRAIEPDTVEVETAPSPMEEVAAPALFEHPTKTLYVLGLFLSVALIAAWQLVRLPLGSAGAALAGVALVATGYLGFRLWLAQQSVSMDATGFDIKMGSRSERVAFRAIRSIEFDRLSHDLLVVTEQKTYRLARTLQGHRVIRLKLLAALPKVAQSDGPEVLVVKTRLLPRLGATLALCVMAVCVSVIMWIDPSLGVLNLLGMALPTYVLFDRCIRRSYRLDESGIQIRGLWKPRFHARGELISAGMRKGTLSSTLRLQFAGEAFDLEEHMLGQSLVEVSEFMERNWGTQVHAPGRVSGEYPVASTEAT
jgi:hypothetical protein